MSDERKVAARTPLCPAKPGDKVCLQPLPCRQHQIYDAEAGGMIWGHYYVFEDYAE